MRRLEQIGLDVAGEAVRRVSEVRLTAVRSTLVKGRRSGWRRGLRRNCSTADAAAEPRQAQYGRCTMVYCARGSRNLGLGKA